MTKKSIIVILITLIFVIGCKKSEGGFTLNELEKLSNSDISNFESYILSKGYELRENTPTLYYFARKSNNSEKRDEHDGIISWEEESGEQTVTYQSSDKEFYLRIKKDIENSPYTYISRTTNSVDSKFHYVGKQSKLTLVTIRKSDSVGIDKNYYRIEVTN